MGNILSGELISDASVSLNVIGICFLLATSALSNFQNFRSEHVVVPLATALQFNESIIRHQGRTSTA